MIRYSQTLNRLGLVSVAVLGISLSVPAQAGFKWVSPVAPTSGGGNVITQMPTQQQAMPQITDDPVLVIEGTPYQSNTAQSYNVAPQPLMAQQQVTPLAQPQTYVAPMASASTGQVEGFADNIPLSVALRQIVPQTHGFSVDQGIDMNTLVSWRGGQSWSQVLDGMLGSVGMRAAVDGQMVRIARADGAARSAPQVSAAPTMSVEPEPAPAPRRGAVTEISRNDTLPPVAAMAGDPQIQAVPMTPVMGLDGRVAPVTDNDRRESWRAESGRKLREVLDEWTRRENVELVWASEYDYPLEASLSFSGNFEDGVRGLLRSFAKARPQPFGRLHNNPVVNQRVLVIETRGNNYGE